jgi:prepilin-type processing-associated H-X9-DG protein
MRVFPGALINAPSSMSKITDGTSKTVMLSEVRTRQNEADSRGAWAGSFTGGSIISYDMHGLDSTGNVILTVGSQRRNTPYIPTAIVDAPSLTPNLSYSSASSAHNADYIRGCDSDSAVADVEKMHCEIQSGTRAAAAARSSHAGGVNAAHVDGSVLWINDDVEQYLMARMVSANDGQGEAEGFLAK